MTRSTPILRIDLASREPIYMQISAGLRTLLVRGELAAGSRLPTIRELAMDLGVHANTVAEAYRILAAEGWLELRRRHGATVLERDVPCAEPGDFERWRQRLHDLITEGLAAGLAPDAITNALTESAAQYRDHSKKE